MTRPAVMAVRRGGPARYGEAARATVNLARDSRASTPTYGEVQRWKLGRRLWRFLAERLRGLRQNDLSDRIDQMSEYRKARTKAFQYAMLRNISR